MRKPLFTLASLFALALLVFTAGRLPRLRAGGPTIKLEPLPEGAAAAQDERLLSAHPHLSPNEAAIFLMRSGQSALPASRAFELAGVPFCVTRRDAEALSHRLVFIPTGDRSIRPSASELAELKTFAERGGIIVMQTPPDLIQPLTGLYAEKPSRRRHHLAFHRAADEALRYLDRPEEEVVLASKLNREGPWTHGLLLTRGVQSVAEFPDEAEPAIARKRHGAGWVYTLGFDLRDLVIRPRARRHFDAGRCLSGRFEPTGDVVPLFLRGLYEALPGPRVRLRAFPGSSTGLVVLTHNIGWGTEPDLIAEFSRRELERGFRATYFVQTKLTEDFLKAPMFDDQLKKTLRSLLAEGHELGSHTVAHGPDLRRLVFGTGKEGASYKPTVDSDGYTAGATLLGEMVVSRDLLAKVAGSAPQSFRSAFRSDPDLLDEGLAAAGYRYDSSINSCSALTHFPFPLPRRRTLDLESGVIEFPMSLEDENQPNAPLDSGSALDLFEKVASNEGIFVWLTHPSAVPSKRQAFSAILKGLPEGVAVWPLGRTGRFWSARSAARFSFSSADGKAVLLKVSAPAGAEGLSFELDREIKSCAAAGGGRFSCSGRLAVLESASGGWDEVRIALKAPSSEPARRAPRAP